MGPQQLRQWPRVSIDPIEDERKTKPSLGHRVNYKNVCFSGVRDDGESIDQQKSVRRVEGYALVAINEGMIVCQRLHQRRRFFPQIGVIAGLRPEDGSLQSSLIPQALNATVMLDLAMMNGEYFRDGQVDAFRHLLVFGQFLIQLPVLFVGASGRFHHLRTDQAL